MPPFLFLRGNLGRRKGESTPSTKTRIPSEALNIIEEEREEWIRLHEKRPSQATLGALKALDELERKIKGGD